MTTVEIRPFAAADFAAADRVNRLAFGKFFGLEDPLTFRGDAQLIPGRFEANPEGAFAAERNGRLVGCGFVTNWGTVGLLGPLTVDPAFWGQGIARQLMAPLVAHMDQAGYTIQGLLTHPQSPSHIRLYEAFGYRMDRITGVMDASVSERTGPGAEYVLLSELAETAREPLIAECRAVTDAIHRGFDLEREIRSVVARGRGDVVVIRDRGEMAGFACCHHGAGSEGGSRQVLVKVGVVRGDDAESRFGALVRACEDYARRCGVKRLVAGTNTGRSGAYRMLQAAGFRTWMNGVAMLRTPGVGYNSPGFYVIDDWR